MAFGGSCWYWKISWRSSVLAWLAWTPSGRLKASGWIWRNWFISRWHSFLLRWRDQERGIQIVVVRIGSRTHGIEGCLKSIMPKYILSHVFGWSHINTQSVQNRGVVVGTIHVRYGDIRCCSRWIEAKLSSVTGWRNVNRKFILFDSLSRFILILLARVTVKMYFFLVGWSLSHTKGWGRNVVRSLMLYAVEIAAMRFVRLGRVGQSMIEYIGLDGMMLSLHRIFLWPALC